MQELTKKRLSTGAGEKKFKTALAPKGLKSPALAPQHWF